MTALQEALKRCVGCWAMRPGGYCDHVRRRICVWCVGDDRKRRFRRVRISEIRYCPVGKGDLSEIVPDHMEWRGPT